MTSVVTVLHKTEAQLAAGGTDLSATSFERSWQVTVSDVGSFTLSLQNDDPNLEAIVALAESETPQFVQFSVDAVPRFLGVIDHIKTTTIAPNEEVDQVTTITGRSILGEWDAGVVLPPNGITGQPWTETRVFDWGAPELDISLWGTPALLAQAGQGSEGEPPPEFPVRWLGYPLGWSDPTAYWIWSEPAGAGPAMPAGTSYFARDVNIVTPGYYSVYMSADNRHRLRIDGVLFSVFDDEGSQEGYQYTLRGDVYLTAGVHRVAAEVTNDSGMELAGFLFALWSQDGQRDDDTLFLRGDDTWGAIGYPAVPPGFTAGTVIRILLEQAVAAGVDQLADWTLSFDDVEDSEGNAWPVDRTFAFRVGMKLTEVLRQMAASDIDFRHDPEGRILHAYVLDGMGVAAADATAELTRLGSLTFETRA